MSQLLKSLFQMHRLQEEVKSEDTATLGGGDGGDLSIDVDKAADAIGSDLGLNDSKEGTDELLDKGSATPPKDKSTPDPSQQTPEQKAAAAAAEETKKALEAAKKTLTDKKVDFTGKKDEEILALAKAQAPAAKGRPKAWKQEMDPVWAKLPVEAQTYIEQREAQVEEGFKQYAQAGNYARAIAEIFQPYEALLKSQGAIDHRSVVSALLNGHFILSTKTEDEKARFFAVQARHYGINLEKTLEAFKAGVPAETPEAKALRERMDKLERDRQMEAQERYNSIKADTDKEVAAFAADPQNIYFMDVAEGVARRLKADEKLSLKDAYDQEVWANPVTRAKETARLQKESDDRARREAEEKAKEAEKARGVRIKGKEEHRGGVDLIGSMDDTLRETLKDINSRP